MHHTKHAISPTGTANSKHYAVYHRLSPGRSLTSRRSVEVSTSTSGTALRVPREQKGHPQLSPHRHTSTPISFRVINSPAVLAHRQIQLPPGAIYVIKIPTKLFHIKLHHEIYKTTPNFHAQTHLSV